MAKEKVIIGGLCIFAGIIIYLINNNLAVAILFLLFGLFLIKTKNNETQIEPREDDPDTIKEVSKEN